MTESEYLLSDIDFVHLFAFTRPRISWIIARSALTCTSCYRPIGRDTWCAEDRQPKDRGGSPEYYHPRCALSSGLARPIQAESDEGHRPGIRSEAYPGRPAGETTVDHPWPRGGRRQRRTPIRCEVCGAPILASGWSFVQHCRTHVRRGEMTESRDEQGDLLFTLTEAGRAVAREYGTGTASTTQDRGAGRAPHVAGISLDTQGEIMRLSATVDEFAAAMKRYLAEKAELIRSPGGNAAQPDFANALLQDVVILHEVVYSEKFDPRLVIDIACLAMMLWRQAMPPPIQNDTND